AEKKKRISSSGASSPRELTIRRRKTSSPRSSASPSAPPRFFRALRSYQGSPSLPKSSYMRALSVASGSHALRAIERAVAARSSARGREFGFSIPSSSARAYTRRARVTHRLVGLGQRAQHARAVDVDELGALFLVHRPRGVGLGARLLAIPHRVAQAREARHQTDLGARAGDQLGAVHDGERV